jgi:hypothetical protein
VKLLRALLAWLRRPASAPRLEALRAEVEAALARRRERRAAYQARARKAVSTRIHNRLARDVLASGGTINTPEGD